MSAHLTEDMLIRHAFDLAEGQEARDTAEHLTQCESCRMELERLQAKFKALDVLGGEIAISGDLISRVVEEAKTARPVRVIPFGKPAWMAAAAVLVVGVSLFMLANPGGPKDPGGEIVKENDPGGVRHLAEPAKVMLGGGKFSADGQEKAPFAPASAIELVVLPRREKVQLTIYNSADLTLVRERRNLTMKKGWNWLQFMWANTLIDPTSLNLEPLKNTDKIDIQQLVYPARLKDIGRWLIRSEVEGLVPFEITYLTSGLHWRAFYMGTLSADEKMMQLSGYVRVDNGSGEDYEDAQTRLIVGKVHQLDQIAALAKRQYPYDRPGLVKGLGVEHGRHYAGFAIDETDAITSTEFNGETSLYSLGGRPKEIKKEGLSEYFLYTIEGTETIPNTWGKRLPSFDADDIPVESLYKYDEQRWGRAPIRFLSFANDEDHELGETPPPNGSVKVYRHADDDGLLSYVGGADIKYIPVDEDVELKLGAARQVKVACVLMAFETANYKYNGSNNIAGWDEIRTWKITVKNTRDIAVKVEVYRNFGTPYWDLDNSGDCGKYEKDDLDTVKYTLGLDPHTKKEFQYVLRTYHGTREEDWRK
ncbi:MAG: DUF4139 domain-containing protein [Planctomycetes bacterium]|nr:DUF4139 domain-containing protein [Planctomycetota bacterium]